MKGEERIGLIAGAGQFPLLFAHAAHQAGFHVVAVASTAKRIRPFPNTWMTSIGSISVNSIG